MRRVLVLLAVTATASVAEAAPLTANSGSLVATGSVTDSNGAKGDFEVKASLQQGKFTGTGKISLGDVTVEAPLLPGRSYLENGRCIFYFEKGRSRVELSGRCDSTTYGAADQQGFLDSFFEGGGSHTGRFQGTIKLIGAGAKPVATGVLPTAKLTCAYQEVRVGVGLGVANTYSLAFSNMGSLTLKPGGTYVTAHASGTFKREGDKIRLTSGPFAGATGTLEPDKSGAPAVMFYIEENRRPAGSYVDVNTTRCTQSR